MRLLVVRVLADARVGVGRLARGSASATTAWRYCAGVVAELLLRELALLPAGVEGVLQNVPALARLLQPIEEIHVRSSRSRADRGTLPPVPERGFLVINPRSGRERARRSPRRRKRRGIATHLLEPGDDVQALAREADADALGAGGGDGTLGAVAAVAIERGLPFFVVPVGTRNHFARDLGLDPDDPSPRSTALDGTERPSTWAAQVTASS